MLALLVFIMATLAEKQKTVGRKRTLKVTSGSLLEVTLLFPAIQYNRQGSHMSVGIFGHLS